MTTDIELEKNINYLTSGMYYLGFGDRHTIDLVTKMEGPEPNFQLEHTALRNGKETNYQIDFKKAKDSDWKNLTGFRATLKDQPERTQYFSVYLNKGITAKEASSLLEGRPICKTETVGGRFTQEVWHRLDFDKKTKSGNFVDQVLNKNQRFSLERGLKDLPWSKTEGKGMPDWAAADLKKGNELTGTMNVNGVDIDTVIVVNLDWDTVQAINRDGEVVASGLGLDPELLKRREERAAERAEQAQQNGQAQPAAGQDPGQSKSTQADNGNGQQQNPVDKSIANDPVQKKTNAEAKAAGNKVETLPKRTHAPVEGPAEGKGKRR